MDSRLSNPKASRLGVERKAAEVHRKALKSRTGRDIWLELMAFRNVLIGEPRM